MHYIPRIASASILLISLVSCGSGRLTHAEKRLIEEGEGLMKVYTIADREDSLLLRQKSAMFSKSDLKSDTYRKLAERMLATVTDPSQDGVGIAGPQVGLLRRVVAVQRFDKEGNPFEVYPNVTLEKIGSETCMGGEGCLSVPNMRGTVERSACVRICYTDPVSLKESVDTVSGFTAVIFQHECDHLDGVLYIDRMTDQKSIGR
ncbi:MAG: peptide deformylase [Bacteroidales bacterium]|nr:peptide deformylase [Bacteroidales bacterium]